MNAVRLLRSHAGVTQQTLAIMAKTSQPAIAFYESGAKSPTLATLHKLALSLGFHLILNYTPKLTREDQRGLAYHHAVAEKIKENPASCIKRAKVTLKKMIKKNPGAKSLLDQWQIWLDLPPNELTQQILDPGMPHRDMRQVSPFAGILTPKERVIILKRFRKESVL